MGVAVISPQPITEVKMRNEKGQFVKGHNLGFQKGNKIRLGIKHSEEAIKKMSETTSGENHPNYGKHRSDATKLKISLSYTSLRMLNFIPSRLKAAS